ncbi:hypothetical protein P7C70_g9138, partial [Phenoliferia sp. Uapishka_3]
MSQLTKHKDYFRELEVNDDVLCHVATASYAEMCQNLRSWEAGVPDIVIGEVDGQIDILVGGSVEEIDNTSDGVGIPFEFGGVAELETSSEENEYNVEDDSEWIGVPKGDGQLAGDAIGVARDRIVAWADSREDFKIWMPQILGVLDLLCAKIELHLDDSLERSHDLNWIMGGKADKVLGGDYLELPRAMKVLRPRKRKGLNSEDEELGRSFKINV